MTYDGPMSARRSIAVVVGSLRQAAWSRKLALALVDLAPSGLDLRIVEIGALPLYDEDAEAEVPPAWASFRQAIRAADGVLFVTPEYNRSVPGVLKNAIDVGSRPYGQSAWAGKPVGIASCSPGALGGFGANHHLRQSFVFLGNPVLQQPEVYVGHVNTVFDADGKLTNDKTRELLQKFLDAYAKWVELHLGGDRS